MDMNKNILFFYFFIYMLVGREKERGIYKMEAIIRKGMR
jgi:hypothetical protein